HGMLRITSGSKSISRWVIDDIQLRHFHTAGNAQIFHNPPETNILAWISDLNCASHHNRLLTGGIILNQRIEACNSNCDDDYRPTLVDVTCQQSKTANNQQEKQDDEYRIALIACNRFIQGWKRLELYAWWL